MQQTKKFKMADAISPYLAVSCGLIMLLSMLMYSVFYGGAMMGQIWGCIDSISYTWVQATSNAQTS